MSFVHFRTFSHIFVQIRTFSCDMSVVQGLRNGQGAENVLYGSLLHTTGTYKEHSVN